MKIVRDLLLAELAAYGLLMGIALSAHWAKWYRQFALYDYVSFTVLEFTGLAIIQVAIILFVMRRSFGEEKTIHEIIRGNESEQIEFKTTFRWDVKRNQVNKELERGVVKTIAAFLNSEGGSLVIGVDDRREVFGLDPDLSSLTKKNHDGFENHFNNIFRAMIGPEFRRFVRLSFHHINGKYVCLVQVEPAHRPVYVKTEKNEDFFIRTGNATTALKMSEVAAYLSSWRQ